MDNCTNADVSALESSLKSLLPAASSFDRDRLFFRAGQAKPSSRRWPITAGVLALVAGTLGTLQVLRPEPPTLERVVYVRVPVALSEFPPEASQPAPALVPAFVTTFEPDSFFRLRDQVLRGGLDALPEPTPFPAAGPPARPTTLLDRF